MNIKLIDPHNDKNFSIQFFDITPTERSEILRIFHTMANTFNHINSLYGNPFLQGDSNKWIMIEFWTNSIESIIRAGNFIEKELKIKIDGL